MRRRTTRTDMVETFHKRGVPLTAVGWAALALLVATGSVGVIVGALKLRH